MDSDTEPDSRTIVLRRFRCVAFAALGEGVTEAELLDALQVAVVADARRDDPASGRHLAPVPTD